MSFSTDYFENNLAMCQIFWLSIIIFNSVIQLLEIYPKEIIENTKML